MIMEIQEQIKNLPISIFNQLDNKDESVTEFHGRK